MRAPGSISTRCTPTALDPAAPPRSRHQERMSPTSRRSALDVVPVRERHASPSQKPARSTFTTIPPMTPAAGEPAERELRRARVPGDVLALALPVGEHGHAGIAAAEGVGDAGRGGPRDDVAGAEGDLVGDGAVEVVEHERAVAVEDDEQLLFGVVGVRRRVQPAGGDRGVAHARRPRPERDPDVAQRRAELAAVAVLGRDVGDRDDLPRAGRGRPAGRDRPGGGLAGEGVLAPRRGRSTGARSGRSRSAAGARPRPGAARRTRSRSCRRRRRAGSARRRPGGAGSRRPRAISYVVPSSHASPLPATTKVISSSASWTWAGVFCAPGAIRQRRAPISTVPLAAPRSARLARR